MKKLFLLLAMVGMLAVACEPGGGVEDENGNQTEQPGGNDTGSEDAIPTDKIVIKPAAMEVANEACDYIVAVYSPCSWRATTEAEWITFETKLGIEGKRELIFSVADYYETEPREGKIIVSNNDEGLSAELTITQKAYVLSEERVIYYTSSDEAVVHPSDTSAFGANILSNTYKNGQGIIIFDAPVIWIEERAFYGCSSLTSVTIPDSVVTSIGSGTFWDCNSLTSVTIGNGVTSIRSYAFYGCSRLTSITIPNSVTSIGEYAFYKCSSLTSVTIPDSVTSIGDYAFCGCSSLTSVTIPDSVTSIGEWAFSDCSSLTSVTIPNSVTSIGGWTFYECCSLTSVTIPDSVTSIGTSAFCDCSSLTSVTIPDSVTKIGTWAFCDCSSLISVYCKRKTPPTGASYMFSHNASGRKIYVPTASVDAYKSKSYWSNYASDIVGYDF